jgi:hypothetical protein
MKMVNIKKVFISILFIGFALFAIYIGYLFVHGHLQFRDRAYIGIISNIRKLEFNRGLPDIKIQDEWIPLSIEDAKIKDYIQIGDSIVKESGSINIFVYRKDDNGKWIQKCFK